MEKNNRLYIIGIICFLFILGISMNAVTASGQEGDPIDWVASKAEAVAKALSEGKYILLIAGTET